MFPTNVYRTSKHILCSVTFFFFENSAFYDIKWKNTAELGRRQMTIWRMRIARWIPKVTTTHSEYVILTVFRASVLNYTYISCVLFILNSLSHIPTLRNAKKNNYHSI